MSFDIVAVSELLRQLSYLARTQNQYNHGASFNNQQSPAASTLMSNAGRMELLGGGPTAQPLSANSLGVGTAGLSPAGQQTKQRLDTLHEDMLERLARIGFVAYVLPRCFASASCRDAIQFQHSRSNVDAMPL